MIRGTTPTYRFALAEPAESFDDFVATIWQEGVQKINKTKAQLLLMENFVYVYLTQEETLSFEPTALNGRVVLIQLRAWKNLGTERPVAFATKAVSQDVYNVGNEEVKT